MLSFPKMEAPSSRALPAPENRRTYPALDGLRAVAVLMVFTQHYFIYPADYHWGWVGVSIFFVLSGFLITGILYDTRDSVGRFRTFYARRALRIFPLFYLVIIIGWALWPIFHWYLHPAWALWPIYLGNYTRFIWLSDYLRDGALTEHLTGAFHGRPFVLFYGHFWSLCIEEQFYLIWPLLVFWIRHRERLIAICAGALFLVPTARYLGLLYLPHAITEAGFDQRFTLFQCDSLLLGALVALLLRKPDSDPLRYTNVARFITPALLVLFGTCEVLFYRTHHSGFVPDFENAFFATVGLSCINLFGAALILLIIDPRTLIYRLLSNRFLRWLGAISYGFYVFHDIPHVAYSRLAALIADNSAQWLPGGVWRDTHDYLTGAIALPGTLILSSLSFYFFETPFLRLKRYFTISKEEITVSK
jgi:peptidoglycan/LPS O-acetylase OafA/YrhL